MMDHGNEVGDSRSTRACRRGVVWSVAYDTILLGVHTGAVLAFLLPYMLYGDEAGTYPFTVVVTDSDSADDNGNRGGVQSNRFGRVGTQWEKHTFETGFSTHPDRPTEQTRASR